MSADRSAAVASGVHRVVPVGGRGGVLPDGPVVAATVTPAGDAVLVTFASTSTGTDAHREVLLPVEWLRDNCRCTTCRITQTDERRLRPWALPAAAVRSIDVRDGTLSVGWSDGHDSTYDEAWASAVNRASTRGRHEITLWRSGYELDRFAHDDVLHDLGTRVAFFEAFRRDGAAVITAAPAVPGAVLDVMRSLDVTLVGSSLGFLFDVKLDPTGFNVAYTNEALPLHNDNAQYREPPSGQVLSMVVNEATGGESMVADGWCILDQLQADDPDAVDVLAAVPVGFRQYAEHADGFSRSPLVKRDPAGGFTHLRFSNQLMQPLAFDHPRLAEWYRAYRKLGEMVNAPENLVTFRLRGGEMLLVNGYRVLHARTAFVADGPRHLQDVYFNTDDVFNNLERLTGQAVNAMVHG